jgi:hypothetical protein
VVTVRLQPSRALIRRLRREHALPGLLAVEGTDAAGNVSTRSKRLLFK